MELTEAAIESLFQWFRANKRQYPWSDCANNPWKIWVSEVMLQQTRAVAVSGRFEEWMERYPSPAALAEADEAEFLRSWEGLGYYNRARNLAAAAREVVVKYGGQIPSGREEFQGLPGVGTYIAAAVGSMAFGKRVAAIDANLRRIALRLAGCREWSQKFEEDFRQKIESFMEEMAEKCPPGDLNAALMQLGQLVCTSRCPKCESCPFEANCQARKLGIQEEIPARARQGIIQKNTKLGIMIRKKRVFMLYRSSGIARGMWVFPSVELLGDVLEGWKSAGRLEQMVHSYTRFRERLIPEVFVPREGVLSLPQNSLGEWLEEKKLQERPMPSVYRKIVDNLKLL